MSAGMARWIEQKISELEAGRDAVIRQLQGAVSCLKAVEGQLLEVQRQVEAKAAADIKALRRYETELLNGNNYHHHLQQQQQQQQQPGVKDNAILSRREKRPDVDIPQLEEELRNIFDVLKELTDHFEVRDVEASRDIHRCGGNNPALKQNNGYSQTSGYMRGDDQVDHRTPGRVDHRAPVIVDRSAPVIVDRSAPVIADHRVPVIMDHNAPVIMDQNAHIIVDHRAPVIVDHRAPIVSSTQSEQAVRKLSLIHTISKSGGCKEHIRDLVYDPQHCRLVVRTSDEHASLRMLELGGRELSRCGHGIDGLVEYRDLALDSRRRLYVAACYQDLALLTPAGTLHARTPELGTRLDGVAHCPLTDLYVVTDSSDHKVTLLDPETLGVVRVFGSEGSGAGQFKRPLHVATGCIRGVPVIVVSDHDNHRVQVLDVMGRHMVTYGGKGRGDTELYYPRGVAVDVTGRVLVCDSVNSRICSFWSDSEGEHWECLLSREQLGERKPINIHMDYVKRLVIVRLDNDSILLHNY